MKKMCFREVWTPEGSFPNLSCVYSKRKNTETYYTAAAQRRAWLNDRPQLHSLFYNYYDKTENRQSKKSLIDRFFRRELSAVQIMQRHFGMPEFIDLVKWHCWEEYPESAYSLRDNNQ